MRVALARMGEGTTPDSAPVKALERTTTRARRFVKPKRTVVIATIMAVLGTNLEIIDRAALVDLKGHCVGPRDELGRCLRDSLSAGSLAGWSSLWMLPIYGFIGVILGLSNEAKSGFNVSKVPMIAQCFLSAIFILVIEYVTGWLLNLRLHFAIWDYTGMWGGDIDGQICTVNGVIFFFLCPLAYWLDDVIRFVGYNKKKPDGLLSYYVRLFTFRA